MKFELAKDKIRLITNELDNIREHFSVKDETARFRLRGRARFYSNPRIYCITPTGLFEPGLFFEESLGLFTTSQKYLTQNSDFISKTRSESST